MSSSRLRFSPLQIVPLVFAVAGVVYGVWQLQRASSAKLELDQVISEQTRLRAELAKASTRVEAATAQADAAHKDNQLLTATLEKARRDAPAPTRPPPEKPTIARADAEARIRQARELGRNGDPEYALRELLWCWDEGLRALPGPTAVAMRSMVTTALGQLAERHPKTREELATRFAALERQLLAGQDADDALNRFSSLARALQRPDAMIALHDQLEASSSLRHTVAIHAFPEFVSRQRYQDAAAARPFENMKFLTEQIARQSGNLREYSRKSSAINIEALAGAGQLEQARELASVLLRLDDTPETRALLQQHLTRAGQPNLLPTPAR